ncbi:MAG: helix-turn-helix domain-containing protein [Bryobacteraceae bacterium]
MFLQRVNRLEFEAFRIEHLLDGRSRYRLHLDPGFPFSIKFFEFPPPEITVPLNWHERLEIFVPLEGELNFRVGERLVPVAPGDLLIVDNLKLHRPENFRGRRRRAMAISFLPEWVFHAGSDPNEFTLLTPFYCQPPGFDPVLRHTDRLAHRAHETLLQLVDTFLCADRGPVYRAGCKAHLLQLLFLLALHFDWSGAIRGAHGARQRESKRLGKLFDFLSDNYSEKITVADAAGAIGMSNSRFMKFFKESTGTTLIAYLTQLRLSSALRLLAETDLPISEIAARVGMPDQSYFDRKFKRYYRRTPREMRRASSERIVQVKS